MAIFGKLFGSKKPAPPCEIHDEDRDLVRDDDVSWWNTLSFDDCGALERQDNITKLAAFKTFCERDGLTQDEAARRVRLSFPVYYSRAQSRSNERHELSPGDEKLPYVLKGRVNDAMVAQKIERSDVERASSVNAFIRECIRTGKF